MSMRSVVTVTTGEAGSGKSYARCAQFLTARFFRDADGTHWSNFPLGEVPEGHMFPPIYEGETFRDRIAGEVSKRLPELTAADVLGRLQTIPAKVLAEWERGDSGPWDFFEGKDLSGSHIAIDEIHNYCDPQGHPETRKRWRQWLGEIRHQGATVEFLSQSLQKVPLELRREAGLHILVKNTETERDPMFRIELGDWYELRAAWITRRYRSNVMEAERRSAMGDARRFTSRRLFPLDPDLFRFYDSFSAPQKGGQAGKASRRQFERRSRLGVFGWFCAKNAGRLIPRLGLVAFFVWLVLFGGGSWLVERGMAASVTAAQAVGGEGGTSQTVQTEDEVTAEDLAGDDEGMKAERDAALAELEALKAKRGFRIVLLDEQSVTFDGGERYRVGQTIDVGPYEGLSIAAIRFGQRRVYLSDGTVLKMGASAGARSGGLLDSLRGR